MHIYLKLLIISYNKCTLFVYELCGSVVIYPHRHIVWMCGWPFCLNCATFPPQLFNCHYLSNIQAMIALARSRCYVSNLIEFNYIKFKYMSGQLYTSMIK